MSVRREWPTATATDAKQSRNVGTAHSGTTLTDAMIDTFMRTATKDGEWTTPTAARYSSRGNGDPGDGRTAYKNAGTPSLESAATMMGGYLNPDWVECLMGAPIGWTDVSPERTLSMFEQTRDVSRAIVTVWPTRPGEPFQHEWEPPRITKTRQPIWADRLRCIGNAVLPLVALEVGRHVKVLTG